MARCQGFDGCWESKNLLTVDFACLTEILWWGILEVMNSLVCRMLARISRLTALCTLGVGLGAILSIPTGAVEPAAAGSTTNRTVSYYQDIRPIFQANCQGCHQPAKVKGGYVMTDFKKLLAGGDSEGAGIVPKHPDKSSVLKMITPQDGEIMMPKGKPPLTEKEVALIRTWIQESAEDDTPADAKPHYDLEHPPIYSRPPVISSLDFSPDGKLLAVAGFHEVLVYESQGYTLAARLIGLSERIQALQFSPDGKQLAVAGGDPGRQGEIQIWDVATKKLVHSSAIGYDTLYGVSWSPDSKRVAFGCADNTVRTIEASTGKQVMQMGSHNDWVMSTAFSLKGDHVISGGRDMTVKLTEIAEQRFIDNVTSITPGALKGGVMALAAHPKFEEFVAGGSEGLPKVYRFFREVKREIGDDAQLIAELFPTTGRVFSVRFNGDGSRIAYGGGLDRAGELVVCSYDYTNEVSKEIRAVMGKVPGNRKPEEHKQLTDYKAKGIREIARVNIPQSEVYSVAFSPDSQRIAAGGSDGMVRLFNATNGAVIKGFISVPITKGATIAARPSWATKVTPILEQPIAAEPSADHLKIASLEFQPATIKFTNAQEYVQLLVTARLESGDTVDVTRSVKVSVDPKLISVSARGIVQPLTNGVGKLSVTFAGKTNELPVAISGLEVAHRVDFVRDVAPVIAQLGCNAGSCHGAKDGKSGFKLSLRGYDPETDLRALTDDLASRRVNLASPDDSLMLLKAVAEVPHEGGRRTTVDSKYYQILRQWIANGALLDMKTPKVVRIQITPQDPVVQTIGSRQQIRVVAIYADGAERDVTSEAFVESGNADVATTEPGGLISTLRRGEAPVLARYEGNYAATTLTVMGDRTGFAWKEPVAWGKIDQLVSAKWKRMKIEPSDVSSDLEFIRRVYLDLTALPPSPEDIRAFLSDVRDIREKRDALIDRLVGSPDYVDSWANKWADLLQCNSKFLGVEGAESFKIWIRNEIEKNTPYDQLTRKILTATGSNRENPAASYWKIVRSPTEAMENTTHLFLATRFNCNKCHDHPFERWTQDQYYNLSAYFAQVSLKEDPKSEGKKIGGSAVENAQALYEIASDEKSGDVKHDRTGKVSPPVFPYTAKHVVKENATRREDLAAWITSPENRYFASSYVNRLWGYLTGAGIIEPLDDTRAGNPARNPALLEHLTQEFVTSGFDVRHMMRLICKSRTYQLAIQSNKWNQDDKVNYSHANVRRLPAETIFDAVYRVTGSTPHIGSAKPGQRATQLSDAAMDVGTGLLATLGRPVRQSSCECERSSELGLGSVMALLSGPTISSAINEATNSLSVLVEKEKDDRKLINEVFLRVVNRPVTGPEVDKTFALIKAVETDHASITNQLNALEATMAPVIAEQNRVRDAAIGKGKADLVTYDEMTKNLRAELEKRRQSELSRTQQELKEHETLLPAQAAFWETKSASSEMGMTWIQVNPVNLAATGNNKLVLQSDGSITSSAGKSPAEFSFEAATTLTNITGIMLEVLPDDVLPRFGPGRQPDGNFVLSELELKWASGTNKPDTAAKFSDAKADFAQTDYPAKSAVDGKIEGGKNGWAIGGAPGTQRHTAQFKLEKSLTSTNGLTLRFALHQQFGEEFLIGRFRLYVTTAVNPLESGLPDRVLNAIQAPAGQRKPEHASAILAHYRDSDAEFWKRKLAAVKAAEPLPIDSKLTDLKKSLALAEIPIVIDAGLLQLREDARASARQHANTRLTVVQDLTWALINSPEFLFNH